MADHAGEGALRNAIDWHGVERHGVERHGVERQAKPVASILYGALSAAHRHHR
ncbi:hypothetical protein [Nonomuraea cavernae]|uniref:hypothetical protein n=1 Tax=Nonomuraea cavernae TaxID=2045107 RepID=UPI00166DD493|nr:hypothetical protein [Nonomuraea cavernae]MCA2187753.1 hypothetical protein [Nonomuraea cavernae]